MFDSVAATLGPLDARRHANSSTDARLAAGRIRIFTK